METVFDWKEKFSEKYKKMKEILYSVIFIYLINPIFPTTHFDKNEKFLYIRDELAEKPFVIANSNQELAEFVNQRYKRDLTSPDRYENNENITVKVNGSSITDYSYVLQFLSSRKIWNSKSTCIFDSSTFLRQFSALFSIFFP